MCEIISFFVPSSRSPFEPATSQSQCGTHQWSFPPGTPIWEGLLCPIGRIEAAEKATLDRIERARAGSEKESWHPDGDLIEMMAREIIRAERDLRLAQGPVSMDDAKVLARAALAAVGPEETLKTRIKEAWTALYVAGFYGSESSSLVDGIQWLAKARDDGK